MTHQKALEVWKEHIDSIEESLVQFREYSLPDTWISWEILEDLKDSLDEISRFAENPKQSEKETR